MNRFTLRSGVWYATITFGDSARQFPSGVEFPSPLRVNQITPLNSGKSIVDLNCFHPNASEGSAVHEYRLQVIDRGESSVLARVVDEVPAAFIYFSDMTKDWMTYHFPQLDVGRDPEQILEQEFRANQGSLCSQLRAGEERFSRRVAEHWAKDRSWTDAYNLLEQFRRQETVTLDIGAIEKDIFRGDSIAYELMEAMASVWQKETWEGYKGAPRILVLLLARLSASKSASQE